MIRCSETVLRGHPDKFCDQIADRIIHAAYQVDPEAYGQIEVATWSDWIWINGGIATRDPFEADFRKLIVELGIEIGYCKDRLRYGGGETGCNHIDVEKYKLHDAVCRIRRDPREWTHHVNDQAIVIGWAGYDEKVRFLPPEHFLAHRLREALDASFEKGRLLEKQGPDGKLLVRVRENEHPHDRRRKTWEVEHVLVTVQQRPESAFGEICERLSLVLEEAYRLLREEDGRWRSDWDDIELLINPNGPLLNGGSAGDNGQTGRKLAMDFYGPRVPIGGGALSGKDFTHVDRAGALAARRACVDTVAAGAQECRVTIAYAPGRNEPLDVRWDIEGGVRPARGNADFAHDRIRERTEAEIALLRQTGRGTHFFDASAGWNRPSASTKAAHRIQAKNPVDDIAFRK